jgi:hypothetical protein
MADADPRPEELLAALVGPKLAGGLDPSDPAFIIASMFEAQIKAAQTALVKVVTEAAAEMATVTVLSDNAARARSETIITEAARWSSEQIRAAGVDAAQLVLRETSDQVERGQSAAQTVRWGMWITCGASAVSVCAMLVTLLK